jgi:putative transposase
MRKYEKNYPRLILSDSMENMNYVEANEIACKYCNSSDIVRYGTYNDEQYFWCKECKRKFSNKDALSRMKTPVVEIASALNMYYGGSPVDAIQNHIKQVYGHHLAESTIYDWIVRFTKQAVYKSKDFTPEVGDVWIADETGLHIGGHNVWFWDIIDTKTRYLLASHLSTKRTTQDAQILIEKAIERAGKCPRVIITDKLRAYVDGIDIATLGMSKHIQSKPFTNINSTNIIERFHGILKQRTDAIHHFKNIDTARLLTEGWLIHYNFFKDHEVFKNQSPVKHMGLQMPFRDWEDIVRGFDGTKEGALVPYSPEVKTISLEHWHKSKQNVRDRGVRWRSKKKVLKQSQLQSLSVIKN